MAAHLRFGSVPRFEPRNGVLLGHWLFGICLLASATSSGHAHAEGSLADSDRANILFKKGKLAFNESRYGDALRIYNEAWRLKQSPDIAANLAQTESELGKHRGAAEHFAFALAHLLPSTTDEQTAALSRGLELEKKEVGTLRITLEPADSALALDDVPLSLPANGDIFVDPGEHRYSVTHAGYESTQNRLQVSKGSSQVLWIKLEPIGGGASADAGSSTAQRSAGESDAAPPDVNSSAKRSLVPALVGGGLFAAGVTVGVVYLVSGNSDQNHADALKAVLPGEDACAPGNQTPTACDHLHAANASVDRARRVEAVGFAVAGAAALGTAVYFLWPRTSSTAARAWVPMFTAAPGAGVLGLRGRF